MPCLITFRVDAPVSAGDTVCVHLVAALASGGGPELPPSMEGEASASPASSAAVPVTAPAALASVNTAATVWPPTASLVSIPLVTTADRFPLWFTVRPVQVSVDSVVEYKYCILSADGRSQRYESFEGARLLRPRNHEMIVDDILDVQNVESPNFTPTPMAADINTGMLAGVAAGSGSFVRAGSEASALNAAGSAQHTHTMAGDAVASTRAGGVASLPSTTSSLSSGGDATARDVTAPAEGSSSAVSYSARTLLRIPSSGAESDVGDAAAASGEGGSSGRMSLGDGAGVLMVQYQLPIKIARVTDEAGAVVPNAFTITWNDEAMIAPHAAAMRQANNSTRIRWIGTPPLRVAPSEEEALRRALEPFHCIPVFLSQAVQEAYYDGYCRDTLWPIFNNVIDVYNEIPTRWWLTQRQSERWKSYTDANHRFSCVIVENFHEGDMVWIHDYPLMLVPMLLARRHVAQVGVFLHLPFPSSEIFRSLSARDEVLRGLLHADHIGFHLFEYARHFLTACRRIMGLTHASRRGGVLAVDYQGREVLVTVSHIGIEPAFLQSQFQAHPGILRTTAGWARMFPARRIIAGIDSIERLKGVPLKLMAYERLLDTYPELVGRVVLVQYCTSDEATAASRQAHTVKEIREFTARINTRFSRSVGATLIPAVYLLFRPFAGVCLQERLALWAAADIMLTTSIRDGLNLMPFEYVYARGSHECVPAAYAAAHGAARGLPLDVAPPDGGARLTSAFPIHTQALDSLASAASQPFLSPTITLPVSEAVDPLTPEIELRLMHATPGVLILSDFSGASRVLPGSLRVNPWDSDEVASALHHALIMRPEEQESRAASNLAYVRGNTTSSWAERVLMDLKSVAQRSNTRTYMGYGLGLGYRLMGFAPTFKPINMESLLHAYKRCTHRLIVCDYGGTLNVRDSSTTRKHAYELGLLGKDAAPPLTAEIKRALKILSEDPNNSVWIISGKEKDVLQQAFASLPHVGLAAEHGFYYRWGAPLPRGGSARHSAASGAGFGSPKVMGEEGGSSAGGGGGGLGSPTVRWRPQVGGRPVPVVVPPSTPIVIGGSGGVQTPLTTGDNGMPWETLCPTTAHEEWKTLALDVMEAYSARTNGTYVLRKGSALSWLFGDADPEFGLLQAKELQDHLTGVLAAYPIEVLSGHNYVEVRPKGVHKGVALALVMDVLEGRDKSKHALREILSNHVSGAHMEREDSGILNGGSMESSTPAPDSSISRSMLHGRATTFEPAHGGNGATAGSSGGSASGSTLTSLANIRTRPLLLNADGEPYEVPPGRDSDEWRPRMLDFVLCIGDDQADEEMFETVHTYRKERVTEQRLGATRGSTGSPSTSLLPLSTRQRDAAGTAAKMLDNPLAPAPRVSKFGVNVLGENTSVSPPVSEGVPSASSGAAGADAHAAGGAPKGSALASDARGTTTPTSAHAFVPPSQALAPPHEYVDFTVTVGQKPSGAKHFVEDTQQVEDMLKALARAATARQRSQAAQASASMYAASSATGSALAPGAGLTLSGLPARAGVAAPATTTHSWQQRMRYMLTPAGGGGGMLGGFGMSMPAGIDRLAAQVSGSDVSGGTLSPYAPSPLNVGLFARQASGDMRSPPLALGTSPLPAALSSRGVGVPFPAPAAGGAAAAAAAAAAGGAAAGGLIAPSAVTAGVGAPVLSGTTPRQPPPVVAFQAGGMAVGDKGVRYASVRMGAPGAMVGLFASSSRLQALAQQGHMLGSLAEDGSSSAQLTGESDSCSGTPSHRVCTSPQDDESNSLVSDEEEEERSEDGERPDFDAPSIGLPDAVPTQPAAAAAAVALAGALPQLPQLSTFTSFGRLQAGGSGTPLQPPLLVSSRSGSSGVPLPPAAGTGAATPGMLGLSAPAAAAPPVMRSYSTSALSSLSGNLRGGSFMPVMGMDAYLSSLNSSSPNEF